MIYCQTGQNFDNQVWILESGSRILCKEHSQILAMTAKFAENNVHTKCYLVVFFTVC